MQKPGSGNVSWLRLPLTVLCFHVFAEKKKWEIILSFFASFVQKFTHRSTKTIDQNPYSRNNSQYCSV